MSVADQPSLEPDVIGPPRTGHAEIDQALAGLGELSDLPLSDHHQVMAQIHEVLHSALDVPWSPDAPSVLDVPPHGTP